MGGVSVASETQIPVPSQQRGLVIVDVQNDFTEGGALEVVGGDRVARSIGEFLAAHKGEYGFVVASQDWHVQPKDDHFVIYPPHCLADSKGAQFDPEMTAGAGQPIETLLDAVVHKGATSGDLSAFLGKDASGASLEVLLQAKGVKALDICGIAEDICVAATAKDAVTKGYRVRVLKHLSCPTSPDAAHETEEELLQEGVELVG